MIVVVARLPDNSMLRGALTGEPPPAAATDGCAVDAVGLKCRCVVRAEDECMDMGGTFYARATLDAGGFGGIDACFAVCNAE